MGHEQMASIGRVKTPADMVAGLSNYSWQQPIGYNWSQAWRPYFWRSFPEAPIWVPSRDPQADQPPMPHDKDRLRLMETPCQPDDLACQGVSPQGYRYFYRFEQPYQPLCVDFSDKVCRGQPDAHFCFSRTVAKCLAGLL